MDVVRPLWLLLVTLPGIACASRSVPEGFPVASAASEASPEVPPEVVTRSIQEDPPLPGEAHDGWNGLSSPTKPTGGGHEHHAPTPSSNEQAPQNEHAGHEHGGDAAEPTSEVTYVCPMHPDVVSKKEGKCPRCGMTLVPQK
jgi:hypothetical protein